MSSILGYLSEEIVPNLVYKYPDLISPSFDHLDKSIAIHVKGFNSPFYLKVDSLNSTINICIDDFGSSVIYSMPCTVVGEIKINLPEGYKGNEIDFFSDIIELFFRTQMTVVEAFPITGIYKPIDILLFDVEGFARTASGDKIVQMIKLNSPNYSTFSFEVTQDVIRRAFDYSRRTLPIILNRCTHINKLMGCEFCEKCEVIDDESMYERMRDFIDGLIRFNTFPNIDKVSNHLKKLKIFNKSCVYVLLTLPSADFSYVTKIFSVGHAGVLHPPESFLRLLDSLGNVSILNWS